MSVSLSGWGTASPVVGCVQARAAPPGKRNSHGGCKQGKNKRLEIAKHVVFMLSCLLLLLFASKIETISVGGILNVQFLFVYVGVCLCCHMCPCCFLFDLDSVAAMEMEGWFSSRCKITLNVCCSIVVNRLPHANFVLLSTHCYSVLMCPPWWFGFWILCLRQICTLKQPGFLL